MPKSPVSNAWGARGALLARLVKYANSHGLKDVAARPQRSQSRRCPREAVSLGGGTRRARVRGTSGSATNAARSRASAKTASASASTTRPSTSPRSGARASVSTTRSSRTKARKRRCQSRARSPRQEAGREDRVRRLGQEAYLASVFSVLGDEVSDVNELDAWLKANDSDPSGMYVLGDTSGEGVLKVEDDTLPTDVAAESSLLAIASSSSSAMGSSSGASAQSTRRRSSR